MRELQLTFVADGTWLARLGFMNRQALGATIALAFVAAFIVSVAFHSVVAAVSVLLTGITIAFVVGIAWMRTAPNRVREKRQSQHSLP